MPKPPLPLPSQKTLRLLAGALLTVQEFGKMWLEGRREPRLCPRCAYRMVEPVGRRWMGRGRPWRVTWRCGGCRSLYESEGPTGAFERARTGAPAPGER